MHQERVFVFIDGFNLYHAIDKNFPEKYKWCNVHKLADSFINKKNQILKKVFYFTAYATWDKEKIMRHKKYNQALRYLGITCIIGKFRNVQKSFLKKQMPVLKCIPKQLQKNLPDILTFKTFEEKETDVNIATKIIELAFLGEYDHAFVISGDSDLTGAIKVVKKHFPKIKFTSVLPPKSKGKNMQRVCHYATQIGRKNLQTSLLPNSIKIGTETIKIPKEYL